MRLPLEAHYLGIVLATKEIFDGSQGKYYTQQEIKKKQQTIKHLCKKYESRHITTDEIEYCLYSITDNNRCALSDCAMLLV